MDELLELLQKSNLSWLLPNLRQDQVIWNGINQPVFFDKFCHIKSDGLEFTSSDFSPGKLALIALDQTHILPVDPLKFLDSIDQKLLQESIENFNNQALFQIFPQDFADAARIALVLAHIHQNTRSWKNVLDTIQDHPGSHWFAPFVCLYGYIGDDISLLNSLVQPGAITFRLELAVHVVLSNPLPLDIQIATLINLCQSEYGDLLPASERLSLVRAVYEQRPEAAVEFALKWLELFPNQAKHRPDTLHHPIENINLLAENLFQIEINKIAGKSHNLTELLETEKGIKDQIYASINNHYVATFSQFHQGKALHKELFELREQITRQNYPEFSSIQRSINQAEFALLLAEQGFYEDAIQYLPPHDAPLPDDLRILYSIAKISEKSGNHSHAMDAAARIIELFDHRHPTSLFPVWGDYFSLINLGKLLFDLHKPEHASKIFEHSLRVCPNDVTLLELLADSYKQSHKDEQVPENSEGSKVAKAR